MQATCRADRCDLPMAWLGACMKSREKRLPQGRRTVELRMFKRLSIATLGFGLAVVAALPAFA